MTIHDLVMHSGEAYSQEWWLRLARSCGLELGPNDELTREQQMKLKAKFDEVYAHGRNKPEKTDADKRQSAERSLEQYVKERCIFVDLSSILAPAGEETMRNILPLLMRHGRRLFIPQSVIRELKQTQSTMIVVTHEMEFARSVADVVIYMADGVIVEMGTPEDVFTNPASEKTRNFLRGTHEF